MENNFCFDKKQSNIKRFRKFLYLRKKNISLAVDIQNYIRGNKLAPGKEDYLLKLQKDVSSCGVEVLLHDKEEYTEFVASRCCSNKLCAICNENRKQLLRRKYILFFRDNPTLFVDQHDKTVKTSGQCIDKGVEVTYDTMALTLTVPHRNGLYKGKSFYYDIIISDYNRLRKQDFWRDMVYGGECGVETTVNKNGLHIHIHSLLLVKRFHQNRNMLHKSILLSWNRITNDITNFEEFSDFQIEKIKASNPLLSDMDISKLRRGGATLITLENIYEKDKKTGEKKYNTFKARINAILECISYHFKPNMFDIGDGHSDIYLLMNVYKKLKNKKIYQKFGVLQHEQVLNLRCDVTEELETAKEVEKAAGDGFVSSSGFGGYYITSSKYVYVNDAGNVCCRHDGRLLELATNSTRNAIKILNQRGKK